MPVTFVVYIVMFSIIFAYCSDLPLVTFYEITLEIHCQSAQESIPIHQGRAIRTLPAF